MPGQVTHFYTAARIAHDFPVDGSEDVMPCIRKGIRDWIAANNAFTNGANQANDPKTQDGDDMLDRVMATYRSTILDSEDIAIFSAFAAGAVGPDLWTIPSSTFDPLIGGINGRWYFDMGHYNSSHVFPAYTLWQIKSNTGVWPQLQRKYRTAYILGFISHICTDILCHTLVNVFAGAYHQQKQEVWEFEKTLWMNKFNDHNKIEHYWDGFIRYLCFEGYHAEATPWKTIRQNDFGQKEDWNFPNYTDYWKKKLDSDVDDLDGDDEEFLDISTSLPGPFAQLYKATGARKVEPFAREYFYNSYNKADEYISKNHSGSLHPDNVKDESEKLEFFYLEIPGTWLATQEKYLQWTVPSIHDTFNKGPRFFDAAVLGQFINATIPLATTYIQQALAYIKSGTEDDLYFLHNWNLDIGSAIRIKELTETDAPDPKTTVPVCIDLISVFDEKSIAPFNLPSLSTSFWKSRFKPVSPPWNVPTATTITPPPSASTNSKPASLGEPLTVKIKPSTPVIFRLKQVCFYDEDSDRKEIDARFFGSIERHGEPWVVIGDTEETYTQKGYDVAQCIEDFSSTAPNSNRSDVTTLTKASRLFTTTFLGGTGDFYTAEGETSASPSIFYVNKVERCLPRHVRISWCRKWTCTPNGEDEFEPEKHDRHHTIFPCEEMVLSVFSLLLLPSGAYQDLFYNVAFTEEQVESLKKVKAIGINCVVLLFKANEQGTIRIYEAWIDGQKQIIKQEKPSDVPEPKPPKPVPPKPIPPYCALFEDVLFRTNSAVLLPESYGDRDDYDAEQELRSGLAAVAAVFNHSKKYPQQKLLVTAHTDTKASAKFNFDLSWDRAGSILHLFEGGRNEWADLVHTRQHNKDIQTICKWAGAKYGWDCDPGNIDGDHGTKTKRAIKNFKTAHNQQSEFSQKVDETESLNVDLWRAVFDVYHREIATLLGITFDGMSDYTSAVKQQWADEDKKAVGCSEAFPKEQPDRNEFECAVNRRVEVYFLDEELIKEHHPVCMAETTAADQNQALARYNKCRAECWVFRDMPKPEYIPIGPGGSGGDQTETGDINIQLFGTESYDPLANTSYTLTGDGWDAKGTTDSDGRLLHKDVPFGDYTLSVDGRDETCTALVLDQTRDEPQIRFL